MKVVMKFSSDAELVIRGDSDVRTRYLAKIKGGSSNEQEHLRMILVLLPYDMSGFHILDTVRGGSGSDWILSYR